MFDDVFDVPPTLFEEVTKGAFYVPADEVDKKSFSYLKAQYGDDHRYQIESDIAYMDSRPHDCKFKWSGKVPEHKRDSLTCDAPVWFRCVYCPESFQGNCNSKDEAECAKCEMRYRIRVRTVIRLPMLASRPSSVYLVTLTAPGKQRHCLTHTYTDKAGKTQPGVRCDFTKHDCVECVCSEHRVETKGDISEFNFTLASRWNRFMTYLRRFSPDEVTGRGNKASRPFADFEYVKAIEPQKRGALHIHAVIRSARPFVMTPAVIADLKIMAMNLGFGHQFDIQTLGGEELDLVTAARYVAKYISKRNTSTEAEIPFPRFKDTKTRHKELDEVYNTDGEYCYATKPETIRKKVKPPRAWTASRRWGLNIGKLVAQQTLFRSNPQKALQLMTEYMWTVWSHQLGIANPYKRQLAITA